MERKMIAAAVSSALALPMAAHAVEVSVSGHVNRAIIIVNQTGNAKDGDVQHVDANSSETRFRFTGSEDLGNGATAGVHLEVGRPSNWRTRHANVYLSGGFGKLTIGQAFDAAELMAHAKLGGWSWLGGVTNFCSYVSSGPACPSNDGHRREVLRYDTPAIGPVSIAASYGNDDYWDVQAKVAGSMGSAGYDIRIGHIAEYDAPAPDPSPADIVKAIRAVEAGTPAEFKSASVEGDILTISAAFGFGQGTSVAVAWSQKDTGSQVDYQYVELDHSYGDGSVGVYYKTGEYGAGANAGVEGELWGAGIGHHVGGGAVAYAGYRHIEEDGAEDIDLMLAGMRVTFN